MDRFDPCGTDECKKRCDSYGVACDDIMADEIDRLRAELAACQQDAERYRWWRKYFEGNSPDMPDAVCAVRTPAELDAAIDTARKGEAE